ncbi:ABC transporter ATP-binding protein [Thalassobaculum litoreum]|uniref:NitT/TauT family transport system ATP-binding protein n=1 Tax=Thalassobaculum litoreum DSM 18839 TaxID=1123362 RepID=A0A8G2BGA3_9PROT|nr:ABC transporter ATP-binding protein [Thalassobaculum litoreum]SDF23566.1 NitT/TauT family transport system ATP-binding protein [Thalassobaculum litoreum DSM 18839]
MPASPLAAVDLRDVSHSFGTLGVLGPLGLSVARGEFVALVGPSGCGKSTLLRLVAGLVAPTGGGIVVDGTPVTGPDPKRGMVFQQPALFPWLDIAANVRFGLDEQGVPKAEGNRRAADWLAAVDIADFAKALPATLSGGMAQRAALARALAPEPDLLLLDEPFGALDSLTRRDMQALLERVRQRTSATVILVTHDVEEALFLADRVVVLSPRPGRVVAEVAVPFDHPRDDALRLSPAFMEARGAVEAALAASRPSASQTDVSRRESELLPG